MKNIFFKVFIWINNIYYMKIITFSAVNFLPDKITSFNNLFLEIFKQKV